MNRKRRGFTLIELMVVISIISLLSSIILATVKSAREKARDTYRIQQLRQIETALALYADSNSGTIQRTSTYGQSDSGTWDYSSQGNNFMTFLASANLLPRVEDPINDGAGDVFAPTDTGYAFGYHCYIGSAICPNHTYTLGVVLERPGDYGVTNSRGIYFSSRCKTGYTCQ